MARKVEELPEVATLRADAIMFSNRAAAAATANQHAAALNSEAKAADCRQRADRLEALAVEESTLRTPLQRTRAARRWAERDQSHVAAERLRKREEELEEEERRERAAREEERKRAARRTSSESQAKVLALVDKIDDETLELIVEKAAERRRARFRKVS